MTGCKRCGCEAGREVDRFSRWGTPFAIVECDHCADRYECRVSTIPDARPREAEGACVTYSPLRTPCPKCGSTRLRTSKTIPAGGVTTRRHKCRTCGHPFKSVETAAPPVGCDSKRF